MAEESTESTTTTTTAAKTSDGNVKISIEKFEELTRKANEQKVYPTYNQTVIEKTPEMQASDLIVGGNIFIAAGTGMLALGVFMRLKGASALRALK